MIWSFIQTFGKLGVNFLFFALLAKYLNPHEMGVVSICMLISSIILSFSELGFGAALIHKERVSKEHCSTVFFANLLMGLFWAILCYIFADYVSQIFKSEEIVTILKVMSFGFIINSTSLVQIAILQKEMKFKELAKRDILASVSGMVVGVISLVYGAGVWSFVIQLMLYYIIGSLTIWQLTGWRPKYNECSLHLLSELWPFSSSIILANIITFSAKNTDKIIIGGLLGPHALGIYSFGSNLILTPIIAFNGAIGSYLFPKYSAMRDRIVETRSSYLGIMKLTLFLLFPVIIMFSQIVDILIKFVWGDVWIEAVPIIQVLCIVALLGTLIAPSGQLMKSFGKPEWLLYWSFFSASLSLILIFIGIKIAGLMGVAFGLIFSNILSLPIILTVLNRLIQVDIKTLFDQLKSILLASILVAMFFMFCRAFGYIELLSLGVITLIALFGYISLILIQDEFARKAVMLYISGERRVVVLMKAYAFDN